MFPAYPYIFITSYIAPLRGTIRLLCHFNSGLKPHRVAWGKQSRALPNFRSLLLRKKEKDFSAVCVPLMVCRYGATQLPADQTGHSGYYPIRNGEAAQLSRTETFVDKEVAKLLTWRLPLNIKLDIGK